MLRQKFLLVLLLFSVSSVCTALVVGPKIYEQDDFGDPLLPEFTYSLSTDCNASTISLIVMNESNKPVAEAHTYLKYVDFSTPLISNMKSDKDGFALIRLPGNVKLMRGLFILVIEKHGFRSKEVHFDLSPCFTNGTAPATPPNHTQSSTQSQKSGTNTTMPLPTSYLAKDQNGTNATSASNKTGRTNATDIDDSEKVPTPCTAFLTISSLLIFKSFKPWLMP